MAEEHQRQPGQQEPSPEQQPTQLARALNGVLMLLGSDADERTALRSHFLPGQPDTTGVRQRRSAIHKARVLFEDYFDSFKSFLAVAPYNDERAKEQSQLKMQRSLIRQLLGDPANALAPVRLETLVSQHPEWAENYIAAAEDTFYGVLEYYARRHHIDMARLVGREGVRRAIDPDPQSEPDVHAFSIAADSAEAAGQQEAATAETATPERTSDALTGEPETAQTEAPDEQIETPEESEEDDLLPASIASELPDGTRVDWGSVAALSDQLGLMEEESRDPDWRTGAALVLSYPHGHRDDAYFESNALRHRLLDDGEIVELYRRMQTAIVALRMLNEERGFDSAEHGMLVRAAVLGYRARDVLIRHNLRLVRSMAFRHRGMVELDDLTQIGNIGLINAIDSFRPYQDAINEGRNPEADEPVGSISTLANYHIHGLMMRAIGAEKRWRVMQTRNYIDPVGALSHHDRYVLLRMHEEAKRQNPDITYKEVGKWLGFNESSVNRLLAGKFALAVISLNKPANSKLDAGTLEDILSFIEDPRATSALEEAEYEEVRKTFWKTMKNLVNAREYQILVSRYVYKMTHEAISGKLGVSRERVRQLEKQALGQLKDAAPEGFDMATFAMNIPEPKPEPTKPPKPGVEAVLEGVRTMSRPERTNMSKPVLGAGALFAKLGMKVEGEPEAVRDRARRLLACFALTEIEAAVMRERYGLGDDELGQTQQATADKLNMTRGHVSVVDSRMIRFLRAHLPKGLRG